MTGTTLEKAKEIMYETHGDKIIILKFYKYSENGEIKCNVCGCVWTAQISRVARKTGCPNCHHSNDKLSYSFVKEQIEKDGCILVSSKYENAVSKLKVIFSCGHKGKIAYCDFRDGNRCYVCGIKKRANSHRTKKERIINFLKENNLTFISFDGEFKTQKTTWVFYSCNNGHITRRNVSRIFSYPTCAECMRLKLSNIHKKELNSQWDGGITSIVFYCRNGIKDWKKKSFQSCNYKCIITGKERGLEIHHLYSFTKIALEALDNLKFPIRDKSSDYTDDELLNIINEVNRLNDFYPLGVCITRKIHKLFHSLYGIKDTVQESWFDFLEKIKSGEIKIPE